MLHKTNALKRFLAYCIDKAIILFVFLVFWSKFSIDNFKYELPATLGSFVGWMMVPPSSHQYIEEISPRSYSFFFLFIAINTIYFLLQEARATTIGKSVFQLSIYHKNGTKIKIACSLFRQSIVIIASAISMVCCYLIDLPYYIMIVVVYLSLYIPLLFTNNSLIDIVSHTQILCNNISQFKCKAKYIDIDRLKSFLFPFKKKGVYRLYLVSSVMISIYLKEKMHIDFFYSLSFMLLFYITGLWIYNGFKGNK